MSLTPDQRRILLMQDYEEEIRDNLGKGKRTVLFIRPSTVNDSPCFFSAMAAPEQIERSLKEHNWDISIGGGRPGFYVQGKKTS